METPGLAQPHQLFDYEPPSRETRGPLPTDYLAGARRKADKERKIFLEKVEEGVIDLDRAIELATQRPAIGRIELRRLLAVLMAAEGRTSPLRRADLAMAAAGVDARRRLCWLTSSRAAGQLTRLREQIYPRERVAPSPHFPYFNEVAG